MSAVPDASVTDDTEDPRAHTSAKTAARYTVETILDASQQRRALNRMLVVAREAAPFLRFLAARGTGRMGAFALRFRTETTQRSERFITPTLDRAAPCSLRRCVMVRSLLSSSANTQAARPYGPMSAMNN
ncbi:hypothetical protein [Burkholderia ubonensis]|uniref:hypothetical protein n=1 Tax=Burkholderia ubonensis TaxID=101571 RepID=UPI000B238797|nr:hypothetical protein [Burkholderia ubonensis]